MSNILFQNELLFSIPPPRSGARGLLSDDVLWQSLYSGRGFFAGTVGTAGIVTVNGKPARRKIFLLEQESMRFIRRTWSAEDGSYLLPNVDETRQYVILAFDNYNSGYRPIAWDKRYPKVPSE